MTLGLKSPESVANRGATRLKALGALLFGEPLREGQLARKQGPSKIAVDAIGV